MTEAMTDSSALPFDTHAAHKQLTAAGMTDKVADALVHIQARLLTGSLATKADLKELQNVTEARFNAMDARFEQQRADLKELQNVTEARFNATEARFNATDARFDTMDARFDAMDARFDQLRADLEKKMAAISGDMLKWTVGLQIGTVLIIIGVVKLL